MPLMGLLPEVKMKKITELRVFQLLDFMVKNATETDKDYLLIEMSIRKEFTKRIKNINVGV